MSDSTIDFFGTPLHAWAILPTRSCSTKRSITVSGASTRRWRDSKRRRAGATNGVCKRRTRRRLTQSLASLGPFVGWQEFNGSHRARRCLQRAPNSPPVRSPQRSGEQISGEGESSIESFE